MLQPIWEWLLSFEVVHSPFFFLVLAHTTQYVGCWIFTMMDLWGETKDAAVSWSTAFMSTLAFAPLLLLLTSSSKSLVLPSNAPSLPRLFAEILVCGVCGDFLHYWTHRFLHANKFLKNHVHSVHHKYEGTLQSWIGMQVHPLEAIMINFAIYSPFLLCAHPLSTWTFTLCATVNATFAHSGYYRQQKYSWFLSPGDHQIHHERNSQKNYGNILRVWDYTFHTLAN